MDNKFVAKPVSIGDSKTVYQPPHKPVMAVNSLDFNHKMEGQPDAGHAGGGVVSGMGQGGVSGETVLSGKEIVNDTVPNSHPVNVTQSDNLRTTQTSGLPAGAVAQKMKELENMDVHRLSSGLSAINQKPKKGSFQITSVINRQQQELDNVDHANEDADSIGDDFDETNTEDLSSEIMDTSKTTDIDKDPSSEDTVQSLVIEAAINSLSAREKSRQGANGSTQTTQSKPEPDIPNSQNADITSDDFGGTRFRIVKVNNERFMRGRWSCYDFHDSERTSREKSNEDLGTERGSGNSSAASSVHYVPGVDDPTKNPFTTAGTTVYPDSSSMTGSVLPPDAKPGHSIVTGQVSNGDFTPQPGIVTGDAGDKVPQSVFTGGATLGQSSTSGQLQSSSTSIPPTQPVPVSQNITNSVSTAPSDPSLDGAAKSIPNQQPSSKLDFPSTGGSTVPSSNVSPNDTLHAGDLRLQDVLYRQPPPSDDQQSTISVEDDRMSEGGIAKVFMSQGQLTEPLLAEMVQSMQYPLANLNRDEDKSGASTVAIDNKIEQAMDLVKSHLMFAVREEVIVLKEQIKELLEKNAQLENENYVLRQSASPDTLAQLHQNTAPSGTSSS